MKGTGKGGRFIKKEKRSRMEARIERPVLRERCLVVPYKPCKIDETPLNLKGGNYY